ncbi:TPA: glycosyltransferase family 2 protein [Candidatus Collierbacteria bacterium]|uniref:Glycosyltransferase n=1 Tax=Candidatus Collierbacteria bacterium GW2011_GWB2_44_22 TaxID=1618387 RepID=A0A0G1KW96_9BACT|nr:MAG: Glycosyltransferase [Candidatus Collierbacteria bacterium GW2011_GWA2_44_13]KKT48748.1 MAG: Glycosyltransferase [Candidatus Collierbacteria bacterium GW2011_GWB1_44_197]KKT52174.1 MAG: Glycosyltransferase [Candidatus Collierbacteria bacterium GW2011_GWB2_44_22]KKT62338.1 MAG: Glycosyltransferase [Candidatus Collierbacteria bacterium GW2011_GWD1_44_27]KKT65887.1 MAG: Glycosyltransferase [Candidatus Collierbacteria bacterium GW2011_GWC2_44_30]KKT68628.1 MAG: Glycosyltransferase [Microgen
MSRQIEKLSVFLPAYNEGPNLENTIKNVTNSLKKNVPIWELIIVNDGSKDNTGKIADAWSKKDKRISVIHHSPNRGYGAALKSGLYACKHPWISFIDSDGQFDFSEINRFIDTQTRTKADMVIGYYLGRKVSFSRKLNTFAWQVLVRLLFGLSVRDIDCGFKLISKKVIDKIEPLQSERGAFISSEFLIKAKKAGFRIVEIGVNHYPRKQGEGTGANLDVIIQSFVDLIKLWYKLK